MFCFSDTLFPSWRGGLHRGSDTWAQLVEGIGQPGPLLLGADAGQGRSELASERGDLWLAKPAGAFIGRKGLLMWPKYVCVLGLRTES